MSEEDRRRSLERAAAAALLAADVDAKLALVADLGAARAAGAIETEGLRLAVSEPGRPERPTLVPPRRLERRGTSSRAGHGALIHALAHIEFNAVNLALDALCRFPGLPAAFYTDWLTVAVEEAEHFSLLRGHLRTLSYDYGDFSAHDGLWEMAGKTGHDPLVRMALVPRVLEARGLDASPGIIRRLRAAGDTRGAEIVALILRDEVGHVEIGSRWFAQLCAERGLEPEATFARLLREYDAPRPVLPLNLEARVRARFSTGELDRIAELARARRGRAGRDR